MKIRNTLVGLGHPTYFIADIAANHCGDLELAKELIYACAEAGANAAKFQNFTAAGLVSDYGFRHLTTQADHQKKWTKSVFDSYDDASIPLEWTQILQETAHQAGIDYLTSPYSLELLEKTSPYLDAIKLGSGDITYLDIVEAAAASPLPLIIATGATPMDEVKLAVEVAQKHPGDICLMQCNTNYTASVKDGDDEIFDRFQSINLAVLETFGRLYPNAVLGLSDHTHGHLTVLGAVGLYDCRIIEKHFTLDNTKEGQDHAFSMTPKSWSAMVRATATLQSEIREEMTFEERFELTASACGDRRALKICVGDGEKRVMDNEVKTIIVQRRSICAKRSLSAGKKLESSDLESLRPAPADALPPYRINELLGKTLSRSIEKGENIKLADLL